MPITTLNTPKQQKNNSFLTDPKQVASWLSGLPMANLGDAAKQIFKALNELNELEIELNDRKKLYDLLFEPVNFIISGLKRRFIGVAFPLSTKNRKIARLIVEFDLQMAMINKVMIQDILMNHHAKKHLPVAIYQAIHHLTQSLLHTCESYTDAAPKVWLDLHHLYLIAQQQNCLDTLPTGKPLSIKALYHQVLLFAIVVKDRVPQQDIKVILDTLAEFTPYSKLSPYQEDPANKQTLFLIDASQDTPPQHLLLSDPIVSEHQFTLDVTDALEEVTMRIHKQQSDKQHSANVTKHLQWLKQAWLPMRQHQSSRVSRERTLYAALGLNAIHDLLTPQPQHTEEDKLLENEPEVLQDTNKLISSSLEHLALSLEPQELSIAGGSDAAVWAQTASSYLDHKTETPDIWETTQERSDLEQFKCYSLNESKEGYCIQWPQDHPEKLQIGMLIALHSTERNRDQPEIGIIRWIHSTNNGNIQLGIEKLSNKADAILCRIKPKAGQEAVYAKALLFPEQSNQQQPPILTTPSLPYQVGSDVEIKSNSHIQNIKLSKQLSCSPSFSCFLFTESFTSNQQAIDQINQEMIADDYEVIWEQI